MKGLREVQKNLNSFLKNIGDYTEKGMKDVVLDLKKNAQELAPKKTGALRGSASSEVKRTSSGIVGAVGFNTPYALTQHENLDFNHKDGQAKYLEKPLAQNTPKILNHLANSVKSAKEAI